MTKDVSSVEELQLCREADASECAVRRFHALRGASDGSRAAFAVEMVAPLAAAIAFQQEAELAAKRPARFALPLLSIDPDKLALLTLRDILSALRLTRATGKPPTLTEVAKKLGQSCRLERSFDVLRGRARDLESLLRRRNRNRWHSRKRAQQQAAQVDGSNWEGDYLGLHLGRFLVDLAISETGAFVVVTWSNRRGGKRRAQNVLVPTDNGWRWLSAAHLRDEILFPVSHLPMLLPPVAWTSETGGGYLTNRHTGAFTLVKGRIPAEDERAQAEVPESVLSAVNTLQGTPWRLRPPERPGGGWTLLEVLRCGWDKKLPLPGLRFDSPQRLPDRPAPEALAEEAKDAWKKWWKIRKANVRLAADRQLVRSRLQQSSDLVEGKRVYFPYQLDSRGRVYPIPQVIHPQADDMGRALLEFADGKLLGPAGERWLKIHLANTYGLDKKPFDERLRWVEDHQEMITAVGRSPLDLTAFWADEDTVDKPWSFLAACLEWVRFRKEGSTFLSHLPVAVDGTCNGLQHLSALGRDLDGGAATNLVPASHPSDIYELVLVHVRSVVEADAAAGKTQARAWCQILDREGRKAVKKATMTTPYGVTPSGIRKELSEDFAESLAAPDDDSKYLAGVLGRCIPRVVVHARLIMEWLRRVVNRLTQADLGVAWTTPTGFQVTVEHRHKRLRRIGPTGLSMYVYEMDPNAPISRNKQGRSIAPNFIHSLDAAHLALTVSQLRHSGIRHCSTVHDSYAVHACHVDQLTRILREQFVALHRPPLLEEFLREQPQLPSGPLPKPPRPGKLEIDAVLDSQYLFC